MDDYLTVEQVAERLRVTPRTVNNMISRRGLPGAYRLDPRMPKSPWRVPVVDVERIEQERLGVVSSNG